MKYAVHVILIHIIQEKNANVILDSMEEEEKNAINVIVLVENVLVRILINAQLVLMLVIH
jgi:hypothetical protein